MKKANSLLNSIFCVAEEKVPDHGEDCYYYESKNDSFVIASFDGCGGSGSKKYANYSGKTGAYVASRAVCGGVKSWFCDGGEDSKLREYVDKALYVCTGYADSVGRMLGSLGKAFPTTASIIKSDLCKGKMEITLFWAGDSRCYMLDTDGLHQLTEDDLDGQDAMSNLTNDGVMTNVINASTGFEIHSKKLTVEHPCLLITATDGCFGYLGSPMEFEYMLTNSLEGSQNILAWKKTLYQSMKEVSGDDYTLCVALCGFSDFEDVKSTFAERNRFVYDEYINSQKDVHDMWNIYKEKYSLYL